MSLRLLPGYSPAAGDYTTKIAAEVKSLDVDGYILKKWEKRVDKVIKYLIVAGKKVRTTRPGHGLEKANWASLFAVVSHKQAVLLQCAGKLSGASLLVATLLPRVRL